MSKIKKKLEHSNMNNQSNHDNHSLSLVSHFSSCLDFFTNVSSQGVVTPETETKQILNIRLCLNLDLTMCNDRVL